jgi:hypothetical protein
MELYKIIATCTNYTGTGNPRTFDWIPENFEGVKILQKFNFINPIGYTPTASVETMKAILSDKIWLDAIFDTYGLESVVNIAIYKLNATATDYTLKATFSVDFESFVKKDHYSEFALKSVSCIDQYNQTKNTAINFTGAVQLALPTTQNFINYISVQKSTGEVSGDNTGFLNLEANGDSKFFNRDSALYAKDKYLYEFNEVAPGLTDIKISAKGVLYVNFPISGVSATAKTYAKVYKNDYSNPIVTLGEVTGLESGGSIIVTETEWIKVADIAFEEGDIFFVGVQLDDVSVVLTEITGDFSVEMYVKTVLEFNIFDQKIYYLTAETVLNDIFNDKITIETGLDDIGITSAQSIMRRLNYISLTPKDFITDFCAANGAIINFKNDGTVEMAKISTYFAALLDTANAVEVVDFQNVEIGYDTALNFASISVGMEQKKYDVLTYFNDWNKVLTFSQAGRAASENYNLTLTKFRCDLSGIIDFVTKTSKTSTDTSTDLFIFDPAFTARSTDEGFIYDAFTPRDFLDNWRTFLSFIFYNFGKDNLVLSSNSGDDFNLEIEPGYNQFDNFAFSGTDPKILPLKIDFTCLIENVDFTEKILKIANNGYMPAETFGDFLYIFVTEAETTDNLSEQKIKGNLISFPL